MKIYENKFSLQRKPLILNKSPFEIDNSGPQGVIDSLKIDFKNTLDGATKLSNYAKERELKVAYEHVSEIDIIEKVLKHTKR